jgi:translation initiation factor 4A
MTSVQGPRDHDSFDDSESKVECFDTFEKMPLDANLLRGIYSYGFEKPSAIQQRAIVPFLTGGDIIAQAQSGTGKTGAFTVGLLQRVDFKIPECQALVLAPTRDLALQIQEVISHLGRFLAEDNPHFCSLFVGGGVYADDLKKLRQRVFVAVGTPGRVLQLIRNGNLPIKALKAMVIDEADQMLSEGFSDQIYQIFRYLPQDIQVCLFSATMPPEVLDLTQKFMRNPTRILVKKEMLTLQGIKQYYVTVEEQYKLETLMDLYDSVSIAQSIIFCNSRRKVSWLAEEMNKKEFTVSLMHSDMAKGEREKVMAAFRSGSSRVLITTNLLARGIDVQHVSIAINFDLPNDSETYIHRIGRSGRFGRVGVAISFVTSRDVQKLQELQSFYSTEIVELPMNFAEELTKP